MTTVELYIKAKQALNLFHSEHSDIFSKYEKMEKQASDLEEQLKLEAKTGKADIEAGPWRFQFISRYKKWIDYGIALKEVGKDKKSLLDAITTFKAEVDMDAFIDLCRNGVLPEKARIKAYQEEEITPQVRLVQNKD